MIRILTLLSLISSTLAVFTFLPLGCRGDIQSQGLDITYYNFPHRDPANDIFHTGFFLNDYGKYGLITSATGVTDIKLSGNVVPSGTLLGGVKLPTRNFTIVMTGYYRPANSGTHTFMMKGNDDIMTFQIGLRDGGTCCSDFDSMMDEAMILNRWTDDDIAQRPVYLTANVFYPVRIVFVQSYNIYKTNLRVILPDGRTQSTWENIYQLSTCYQ